MSNDISLKTSIYGQSPFKKVPNFSQNIPKLNYINERQLYHPNSIHEKYMTPPVQFGVNVYFGQPKSNYYAHPIYNPNIQSHQDIFFPYHRENVSMCALFKNSLAKSGYKLAPDQTVQYKDTYKKHSSINSFYDNFNYCPISNNNNIINNIYPTFTKVTNVQILSDNDNNKSINNENENKKENINTNNNDKINIKNSNNTKKDENDNIDILINNESKLNNNNNKKVLFETIGNMNNINNKNLLKKKRLRKNNQQLGLLSKFYTENKNWSKSQIKEMSEAIGLKENKIYKWLWDQKNKEYKATKFVVNK